MNKKLLLSIGSLFMVFFLFGKVSAQDDIMTKILQQIETNPSPRESLVQRYYSMDDFYAKIVSMS